MHENKRGQSNSFWIHVLNKFNTKDDIKDPDLVCGGSNWNKSTVANIIALTFIMNMLNILSTPIIMGWKLLWIQNIVAHCSFMCFEH